MKDETRGAIVIAAILASYCGAVYLRKASRQTQGESVTRALGRDASDILKADAIVLVSDGAEAIEIWPRGSAHSASLPDRKALSLWLCSPEAPRETAVVMLRGVPLGRGRLDQASREGRLVVGQLQRSPLPLECAPRARFYSMELRTGDVSEGG
ncbi:MAG: hypothetical protein K1Y01_16895 [Vicinamibacteria bacterium]|nr:hypothetical protein [Vicinamibacteria bacterium]